MRLGEVPTYKEAVQSEMVFLPPNVNLSITFSSHMDATDMGDFSEFRRRIKRSDIYIPESLGWNSIVKFNFDTASQGRRPKKEMLADMKRSHELDSNSLNLGWELALVDALYASNRTLAFVDVPAGHPLSRAVMPNLVLPDLLQHEFSDAQEFIEEQMRKMTEAQLKRDIYILEHIGPVLTSEIIKNPRLRTKDNIDVFMSIGSLHYPIFEVLEQKTKEQREKSDSTLPTVRAEVIGEPYDPGSLLSMHLHPGIDFQLTDEQLALVKIRNIGIALIQPIIPGAGEKLLVSVTESLLKEEIEELFNLAKSVIAKNTPQRSPVFDKIADILQGLKSK